MGPQDPQADRLQGSFPLWFHSALHPRSQVCELSKKSFLIFQKKYVIIYIQKKKENKIWVPRSRNARNVLRRRRVRIQQQWSNGVR